MKHVQRRKMYCKWVYKYTNRRRMPNNNDTVKVVEIKPELYADSHGRQLPQIIDSCINGKVVLNGVVASGADMKSFYSLAAKSQNVPIILVAVPNEMSKRSPNLIYKKVENELNTLCL